MRHPSLAAGTLAPLFELRTQEGATRRLSDLLALGPVLLAFHLGTW